MFGFGRLFWRPREGEEGKEGEPSITPELIQKMLEEGERIGRKVEFVAKMEAWRRERENEDEHIRQIAREVAGEVAEELLRMMREEFERGAAETLLQEGEDQGQGQV